MTHCLKSHDICVAEDIIAEAADMEGKKKTGKGRYIVNSEWFEIEEQNV